MRSFPGQLYLQDRKWIILISYSDLNDLQSLNHWLSFNSVPIKHTNSGQVSSVTGSLSAGGRWQIQRKQSLSQLIYQHESSRLLACEETCYFALIRSLACEYFWSSHSYFLSSRHPAWVDNPWFLFHSKIISNGEVFLFTVFLQLLRIKMMKYPCWHKQHFVGHF